jgi:molybdate transport system regulatory protein
MDEYNAQGNWRMAVRHSRKMPAEHHVTKISIRIDFGKGKQIGPGKIALLECIAAKGSLVKAAKEMEMSYRRAWLLVQDLNASFDLPCVTSQKGGARGGGAVLTALGTILVKDYRALEKGSEKIAMRKFKALTAKK